jgi:outer membrane protein TolC
MTLSTLATAADNSSETNAESTTRAQEPTTLESLIELGLKASPAAKAKKLAWKQTLQRYPQARALPDPTLSYTQPIEEIETRLGPNKRSYKLSQGFPFPGTLKTRGKVARKEAAIARLELDNTLRQLVLDIKKAFFELYYLDQAAVLAKEKTRLFKHLTKARSNEYSVDSTDFSNVIEAETRFADAEYEQILLDELREAASTRLNTLLNRDPETIIGQLAETSVLPPDVRLQELYKKIKTNEDIKASEVLIEKKKLKEKLARLKTLPRFKLALNYTEIGAPETNNLKGGGKDAASATIAITLPIWHRKNKGRRVEARLARQSAEQARIALINSQSAKAKTYFVDMQSNYQLLRLYSDSLIPKAEKLIKTAEAAYKNGKGGLSDLFEPRIMRVQFMVAYYRAASNYKKTNAELEKLTAGFTLKESSNE